VIFAIAGEAEASSFASMAVHIVRWGELGRLFRLAEEAGCREAVFIGSVSRRPDMKSVRPDIGAVMLMPRVVQLMRGGDDSLLSGIARIFEEKGLRLVSALDVAPELGLVEGCVVGKIGTDVARDVEKAAEAARALGRLDIAQGAVAVGGRVIAVEDVGGTDALLERVAALRAGGKIESSGGVLVKCVKPIQDRRLDLPAIGPATASLARRAGLAGVAAEAGVTLLAGRSETVDAFRRAGLFLLGLKPPSDIADG
jgi:DUF1009 family protein